MKTEKLMDYIGQIDDGIIAEAASDGAIIIKPAKRAPYIWGLTVAAGLAAAFLFMFSQGRPAAPNGDAYVSNLPKLTVNTDFEAFGFEGYMAFDIEELRDGNPWTEDNNLAALPVFANPVEYDRAGRPLNGLSAGEMLARAEETARLLGLDVITSYTTPTPEQIEQIREKLTGESEETIQAYTTPTQATAECGGATIVTRAEGHTILSLTPETAELAAEIGKLAGLGDFIIAFDFGYEQTGDTLYSVGLPLGERFTYSGTSYEQAMRITGRLFAEYGGFTGIKTPGYNLFADYNIYAELSRMRCSVFENAGSLTERILNYHFSNIYFTPTDLGGLGSIGYFKTDLSGKIGDYPIITAREARALLLEKHYISSVMDELPGEAYIARVSLVYRTGRLDAAFMPYYRFLVELPAWERENGLKTFGAFYVPAVRAEFLENMPLWDGSFN